MANPNPKTFRGGSRRRIPRKFRYAAWLEQLEDRVVPANLFLDVGQASGASPVIQAIPTSTVKVFIDVANLADAANAGGISSAQFYVKYDPSVLRINETNPLVPPGTVGSDVQFGSLFTGLPSNKYSLIAAPDDAVGLVGIDILNTGAFYTGTAGGHLVELDFHVLQTATIANTTLLDLTSASGVTLGNTTYINDTGATPAPYTLSPKPTVYITGPLTQPGALTPGRFSPADNDLDDAAIQVVGGTPVVAPTVVNDSYTMAAPAPGSGAVLPTTMTITGQANGVLGNDTDSNGAMNAFLAGTSTPGTATINGVFTPTFTQATAHGSVTLNEVDGSFTYTPTVGFVGLDTFQYTASDALSGTASAGPATVTIQVGSKFRIPKILTLVSPATTVVVPVMIDDPDPNGSGGLAGVTIGINYDATKFTVSASDVTKGALPTANNWSQSTVAFPAAGQIVFVESVGTGVGATPITTTVPGSLAFITLHLISGTPGGTSLVNLSATMPAASGLLGAASSNPALALFPPPIDDPTLTGSGSTDDGLITITPAAASTTTTVSTSNAAPTYGTAVTLTATVSAGSGIAAPTLGSVQFSVTNGGVTTPLGGPVSIETTSGTSAVFTLVTNATTLQAGQTNAISAAYAPGTGFAASASTNTVDETVTPFTLTVIGITAANKGADGTTVATLNTTAAAVTGVISPDVVTLVTTGATGAFASSAPGNNITVTVSGLSLAGAQAADYKLTTPQFTTTANITTSSPIETTTVSTSNATPVYGTAVTLTATVAAGGGTVAPSLGSVQFSVTNGGVTTPLGGVVSTDTTSGTNAIFTLVTSPTALQAGQTNAISAAYTPGTGFAGSASFNTVNETVTPFTLTVTGITANNKPADGTTVATLNTTAAALTGVVSPDVVTLVTTGATGAFASANAGNAITVTVSGLSLSGAQAADYKLPTPQFTTTANITAATGTPTTTTVSTSSATPTYGTQVTLTATVAATTGTAAPSLGSVQFFVTNGGVQTSLGTATTDTTNGVNAVFTLPVGGRIFQVGQLNAVSAVYTPGTNFAGSSSTTSVNETVAPRALGVTGITAGNKTYDNTTAATLNTSAAALTSVLVADQANLTLVTTGATGTFASTNVANGITVTVSGLSLTGTAAVDYALPTPQFTTTANITAKTLTVTGITANNKLFDGTTVATLNTTAAAVTGVISPDVVTLVTTGAVGAFASAAVGNNITVTVSGLSLSGTAAANYALPTPQVTTTANILLQEGNPPTTTTVSTSNGTPTYGTAVTLTATVAATSGTTAPSLGSVQFYVTNGGVGTPLGGAVSTDTTSGTNAVFTLVTTPRALQAGQTNAISATYAPGTYFAGSFSTNTVDETVTPFTVQANVTANNKTYDGTTTAILVFGTPALQGVIGTDAVTLVTTGAVGTFSDKNVGTAKTVTVSGLSLAGAQASDYALPVPQATTQANITPKAITVTGITATKVYDATTLATLNTTSAALVGVFGGDTVTLNTAGAVGTYANRDVGTNIPLTVTGLTLGGAQAADYTLPPLGTGAPTGVVAYYRFEEGAPNAFAFGTNSILDSSGNGLNGTAVNGPVYRVDVGANPIPQTGAVNNLALALNGNFQQFVAIPDNPLFQLTQSLTIEAYINVATFQTTNTTNQQEIVFRGDDQPGLDPYQLEISNSNLVFMITDATNASASVSVPFSAFQNKWAFVTASLNDATGTMSLYINGNLVGSTTTTVRPYGPLTGTNPGLSIGNVQDSTTASEYFNGLIDEVRISNQALQPNQFLDSPPQLTLATGTITPSTLTVTGVTANNKAYDSTKTATLNVTNASLVGVFGGDAVTLVTTGSVATFASKDVGTNIPVTVTGLTLGGAQAGDYTLTQPTTAANVTPRALTGAFTAANKPYDGTTTATTVTRSLTGVLAADTGNVNLTGGTATFSDPNVGNGKTVTGTGFTLAGTAASDYSLPSTALTTTANITALMVTGNFTAANKPYDGTNTATITARAVTGVLAADTANVTLAGGTATFSDANVGTGKTVTGTGFSLSGTAAGNYALAPATLTTAANITALTVTGGFTAANKIYDATTTGTITGRTLTGVLPADTANVTLTGGTATFSDSHVGTGKTVTGTGFTLGGPASGNYSLASGTLATTANITPDLVNIPIGAVQGIGSTITSSFLKADSADNPAIVVYTLVSAPTGTLKDGTTTLTAGSTFTQADINAGSLTYTGTAAGPDSFQFSATDGQGGTVPVSTFQINVSSTTNNNHLPGVIIGTKNGLEGDAITFQVTLASLSGSPVTYDVFTTDGTALAGTHYSGIHAGDSNAPYDVGTITIPAGLSKGTITVKTIAGASPGGTASKFFTVSVSNPSNPTVPLASATGLIISQTSSGNVQGAKVIIGNQYGVEGLAGTATPFIFQAILSAAPSAATTYDVFTTNGTAIAGTNYVGITPGANSPPHDIGTVTFAAGNPKATVTVYVDGGSLPTNVSTETFTVSISSPAQPTVALATATGTIEIQNPQMALGTPTKAAGGVVLSSSASSTAQLNTIVAAAEANWAAAGVPTSKFQGVQFVVGNIATSTNHILANTVGKTITIDAGAAGFGWYIDAGSAAFQKNGGSTDLTARAGTPAVGHMDLLTVVEHELGHILGLSDVTSGPDTLMSEGLGAGTRRLPDASALVSIVPPSTKLTQVIVPNLTQPKSSPYVSVAGLPPTNTVSTAAMDAVFSTLVKAAK